MMRFTRREFVSALTLAGTAGRLGMRPETASAEPPPETTQIRPTQIPDPCSGTPLIVADDLLRAEGFTDVRYVARPTGGEGVAAVVAGEADIGIAAVFGLIPRLDAGDPLLILGGTHVGCFELFGSERIRSMRDFKGKKVAVTTLGSARHLLTASMAAHVGLDPRKDIDWIENPAAEAMRLFTEGKIDGFIGFPPEPQELRAKKVGHVNRRWPERAGRLNSPGLWPTRAEHCSSLPSASSSSAGRRQRLRRWLDSWQRHRRRTLWAMTPWRAVQHAAWTALDANPEDASELRKKKPETGNRIPVEVTLNTQRC